MKTFEEFYHQLNTKSLYENYGKRNYRFDRIPRDAQSVYDREGNRLLQQATAITERSHESVSANQEEFTEIQDRPRRQSVRNQFAKIVKAKEERDLYIWAKENGYILSNKKFDRNWERDGRKGEAENEVYYDEENHTWIKRNNLNYHASFLEFFHRLALHNKLFPEAEYTLIGFVVKENHLWPVISQKHVEAERGATREEVSNHMKTLGFLNLPNSDDYYNQQTGIRVEDLHDENVLVSPDGDLYIVDPVIYLDDEGKKSRLAAYSELEF